MSSSRCPPNYLSSIWTVYSMKAFIAEINKPNDERDDQTPRWSSRMHPNSKKWIKKGQSALCSPCHASSNNFWCNQIRIWIWLAACVGVELEGSVWSGNISMESSVRMILFRADRHLKSLQISTFVWISMEIHISTFILRLLFIYQQPAGRW